MSIGATSEISAGLGLEPLNGVYVRRMIMSFIIPRILMGYLLPA